MFMTDHQQNWPLRPTYARRTPVAQGIALASPIKTARLVIRTGTVADVQACALGIAAADLPWLEFRMMRDRSGELSEVFVDGIRHSLLRHRHTLVVAEKSGTVAGALSAVMFNPSTVQAGWAMFRDFDRAGYAEEALHGLVSRLFSSGEADRVVLRIARSPAEGADPMVETALALGFREISPFDDANPWERKAPAVAAFAAVKDGWKARP